MTFKNCISITVFLLGLFLFSSCENEGLVSEDVSTSDLLVSDQNLPSSFCEDADLTWVEDLVKDLPECVNVTTEFYTYNGENVVLVDFELTDDLCPIADLAAYYFYCDGTPICGWNGATGELDCELDFIENLLSTEGDDFSEIVDDNNSSLISNEALSSFCEDADLTWVEDLVKDLPECVNVTTEFYTYNGENVVLVDFELTDDLCPIADLAAYYFYCDGTPICGWNGATGELDCELDFIENLMPTEGDDFSEIVDDNNSSLISNEALSSFCEGADLTWVEDLVNDLPECVNVTTEFYTYKDKNVVLVEYLISENDFCPIADLAPYYFYCDGTPICGWNGATGELDCELDFIENLTKV